MAPALYAAISALRSPSSSKSTGVAFQSCFRTQMIIAPVSRDLRSSRAHLFTSTFTFIFIPNVSGFYLDRLGVWPKLHVSIYCLASLSILLQYQTAPGQHSTMPHAQHARLRYHPSIVLDRESPRSREDPLPPTSSINTSGTALATFPIASLSLQTSSTPESESGRLNPSFVVLPGGIRPRPECGGAGGGKVKRPALLHLHFA